MNEKKALLLGATGLVGSQCLTFLLNDSSYDSVIAIVRRPIPIENPRFVQKIIDFSNLETAVIESKAEDIFCCLGTTLKQAGSKEHFRQVDYDYPLRAAKAAKQTGAKRFFLVSALGANASSVLFYNRVKGELEQALSTLHFQTLCIFRPSLLLGKRENPRLGEKIGECLLKGVTPLLKGRFAKYRGIEASMVARKMLQSAQNNVEGIHIFESDQMQLSSE